MMTPTLIEFYLYLMSANHIFMNVSLLEGGIDAIAVDTRKFHMIFVFKGRQFLVLDERAAVIKKGETGNVFGGQLADGVDAAMILHNDNYDDFFHHDFLFLFKGDNIWRYVVYRFGSDQLIIYSIEDMTIKLTQIHPKLPDSIDGAFSDKNYIYLFKNKTQYRVKNDNFPRTVAVSGLTIHQELDGLIPRKEVVISTILDRLVYETLAFGTYVMGKRSQYYWLLLVGYKRVVNTMTRADSAGSFVI
ncbi:unnamed protein product [Medioppia subpectinata]|uniref:Uncharacterized protein n=1 Tax=Medioppia subpectinata TaxID=1979941 RepID=A0A7R9L0P2_9ACAR|nr:unnamed protein product [Medioppia subpectinata]CAG2113135.1 unnamed protein product [Medioppia subpectinata]